MTQTLADMRRDYTRDGLDEAQAPAEPFALFRRWFDDAVKTEQLPVEPNAMTLATVDEEGRRIAVCCCSRAWTSAASPSSATTTAPRVSSWPHGPSPP